MKQLTIKDFSNAYEFKQAKKQAIKQCNALKIKPVINNYKLLQKETNVKCY